MTVDWDRLIHLRPGLLDIENEMKEQAPVPLASLERRAWYGDGGFKEAMMALVGWGQAKGDPAGTSQAYDVAYDHLLTYCDFD
jgi:hypothetical protein